MDRTCRSRQLEHTSRRDSTCYCKPCCIALAIFGEPYDLTQIALRLSQDASRMPGTVVDSTFDAIQPVTVIKLADWFCSRIVSQVVPSIYL